MILGIILVRIGSELTLSLGTSLIATAVVSITLLAIDSIKDGEQLRVKDLMSSGIQAAYKRRSLEEYNELVSSAKRIDVTGYSLRSFSEHNEQTFVERSTQGKPIIARILLVDPGSSASALMEHAENLSTGQYAAALDALLRRLGPIEGVSVRIINKHLSMMVYRIDDVMYTGPYPHSGGSATALTLKLGPGWVFDRQLQDFEALWAQATAAPNLRTD